VGDTSPVRDLTFVQDTAAAFMAIGQAPNVEYGQPYNAGSGRAVAVSDLISLIVDATQCSKPVVKDSQRFRPAASEVRALLADSSRLERLTGWRPRMSLDEGLEKTIDWWRERLDSGRVRRELSFIT
jgi:UDP-glucose 4-epimerase